MNDRQRYTDAEGFAPLHRAAAFSNRPLIATILKTGFDINTRTGTPLQVRVMKLLHPYISTTSQHNPCTSA